MSRFLYLIKLFPKVNWFQSIRFNIHYFSPRIAFNLPVLLYWRTKINNLSGSIELRGDVKTGIISIGAPYIGVQDHRYCRTVLQIQGNVILEEHVNIGRGSRICVDPGAILELGKSFNMTGDSTIICRKRIRFGKDCLLSWDILIMDTDFHKIYNESGDIVNSDCGIAIGDHVWIGCRSTILKGASIPSNCIIAAGSLITTALSGEFSSFGGRGKGVCLLKDKVHWRL